MRDEEDGENMYKERQRPFLVLVSLNNRLYMGPSLPEVIWAVSICYQEDSNFRVIFDRIYAVR